MEQKIWGEKPRFATVEMRQTKYITVAGGKRPGGKSPDQWQILPRKCGSQQTSMEYGRWPPLAKKAIFPSDN